MFDCLSVCLLTYLKKPHIQISQNFLNMLTAAVARSSFDDTALRYVLPVLWMMSCFHIMEPAGQNLRITDSLVFRRFRQVVALGVKSMYMFSACDHMQSRLMLLLYCHTCDGVSVNNVQ